MILQYPNPILKRKAVRVDPTATSTYSIVSRLKRTMKEYQSVGLAAPQLGISKRIAVVDQIMPAGIIVLINPVVLKREIITEVGEGCLSMVKRGTYLIRRPDKITFKNFVRGKVEIIVKTGRIANIIDHEIDHLNGICGGR